MSDVTRRAGDRTSGVVRTSLIQRASTMRILIAGAGGLIGSAVAGDLTTNGHEVVRLVRHEPAAGQVRWDPDGGTIDA